MLRKELYGSFHSPIAASKLSSMISTFYIPLFKDDTSQTLI